MMTRTANGYRIILESHADEVWTAAIPAFGIVTEGQGRAGALRAASKAVDGYIEAAKERGLTVPAPDVTAAFIGET
jgi:predicted RNase H-like HicB family nuclease